MRAMGAGAAAAAVLCCAGGPAAAQAVRVDNTGGWVLVCQGEAAVRRCSAVRPAPFSDSQGRERAVTFSLTRDAACTTLTGVFDQPIDPDRPVWLTVDGGPRLAFSPAPAAETADFQRFLTRAAGSAARAGAAIMPEGMVREPRRIGITCAALRALLPRLAAGAVLRVEFSPAGMGPRVQPYHWPALSGRAVDLPLADVLARLNHHLQTPYLQTP